MKKSRPLLLLLIAAACTFAALASPAIRGSGSKVYEVRPQINIPEYQLYPSNTTASDEKLSAVFTELETISEKLDSIDSKLAKLSDRLEKIENVVLPNKAQKAVSGNTAAIDQNQIKPVLPAKK
jgi:predicted  nucleic acid-binding Zn-ribbon protein